MGGADYWTMIKEERRTEAARDKNVPINFSQEVWKLFDEVIGSQEHVHYPGALSGDSGRERADPVGKLGKQYAGVSDVEEFTMRDEDGTFNHTLPRCRAEQGWDWDRIKERRERLGEEYDGWVEPDEEEELKKRNEERKRDGFSSGQRKKLAGPDSIDRLVFALEQTSTQTLEQSKDQLKFERERHEEAMKLTRERLQLETCTADRGETYKQKELDHKKKELGIKERELVLAEATVTSNAKTMATLTQVLAALAVPHTS